MKIEDRRIRIIALETRVEETLLLLVTHEPDQCIECQRPSKIALQHQNTSSRTKLENREKKIKKRNEKEEEKFILNLILLRFI